jgi:hypothetical protein
MKVDLQRFDQQTILLHRSTNNEMSFKMVLSPYRLVTAASITTFPEL